MRRQNKALALAAGLIAAAALAQETAPPAAPSAATLPPVMRRAPPRAATVTPIRERTVVIGALAKRTGETRFFTLKPGQYVEFAALRITVRTCQTTPPWERPKLSGAFVQVDERLAGQVKRVFSGWLYAESPSLNVMEHPRYDVWLKSCTMAFPDGPSPAAPAPPAPASESAAKKSPEPTSASASKPR